MFYDVVPGAMDLLSRLKWTQIQTGQNVWQRLMEITLLIGGQR